MGLSWLDGLSFARTSSSCSGWQNCWYMKCYECGWSALCHRQMRCSEQGGLFGTGGWFGARGLFGVTIEYMFWLLMGMFTRLTTVFPGAH